MKHRELATILGLMWVLSILYGEMLAYWVPPKVTCNWPHELHSTRSMSKGPMDRTEHRADYVKVAVIADPQLTDRTSFHRNSKSLRVEIVQFFSDLYMRRAFFASILPFRPDVILFLGDHFDGGPYLPDEEWHESLARFRHIFGLNANGRYEDTQVHYIPGNHDVGYAETLSKYPQVVKRYEGVFGPRNYQFTVGKVNFVAVDAQTLDGHPRNIMASQTWEFVKNASMDTQTNPRVLLTHIPLHRPDWTDCGPDRSSQIINQRVSRTGEGDITYQNYISEEASNSLLHLIKPTLVLSGHDHDQCTVHHEFDSGVGSVKEHTVGTISWQQGNLYPSFMLISAINSDVKNASNPEEAVATHLCFLPMQTHIYLWYLLLYIVTLLSLLLWPTTNASFWSQCTNVIRYSTELITSVFPSGTKEKIEDADYEYEMMWDAQGTMHLIKKSVKTSERKPNEQGLVERGSAVLRPTAKKNTLQDIEASGGVDVTASFGMDSTAKLTLRPGKSKAMIVIQRLMRTFRTAMVIAAVVVPLYMMILFKDWIDK